MVQVLSKRMQALIRENPKAIRWLLKQEFQSDRYRDLVITSDDKKTKFVFKLVTPKPGE